MKQLTKKSRTKEKNTPKQICAACKYFLGLNPFMGKDHPLAFCCPLGLSKFVKTCDPWENADMKYCYSPQTKNNKRGC